jgi:hypothetical protein
MSSYGRPRAPSTHRSRRSPRRFDLGEAGDIESARKAGAYAAQEAIARHLFSGISGRQVRGPPYLCGEAGTRRERRYGGGSGDHLGRFGHWFRGVLQALQTGGQAEDTEAAGLGAGPQTNPSGCLRVRRRDPGAVASNRRHYPCSRRTRR